MSEESDKLEKVPDTSVPQAQSNEGGGATKTGRFERISRWTSAYEAIKLSTLPRKKFRYTDRVTDILAAISILTLLILIFAPAFRPASALLCVTACMVTIIFFIVNRLGVLTTIPERKAVLVWDIILGASLLGVLVIISIIILLSFLRLIPKMI
jgi:hypothetical protein